MDLASAVSTIEYKIATESENFEAGRTLKMDINPSWPGKAELTEALQKRFPFISVNYDFQPNDRIQLLIKKR